MNKKKPIATPVTEKFFRAAAKVWIDVYGEVMPLDDDGERADPGIWGDGCEKRHLKLIVRSLRERAEKKNIVWTEDEMQKRLRAFLLTAWSDEYLSQHFMLRILNINKPKIFNNQIIAKKINGTHQRTSSASKNGSAKNEGTRSLLASVKQDIAARGFDGG